LEVDHHQTVEKVQPQLRNLKHHIAKQMTLKSLEVVVLVIACCTCFNVVKAFSCSGFNMILLGCSFFVRSVKVVAISANEAMNFQ
jgi:CRISPR/Cas system type I-B associated protein Csh2 (Cas7 group RAMP superfamily)